MPPKTAGARSSRSSSGRPRCRRIPSRNPPGPWRRALRPRPRPSPVAGLDGDTDLPGRPIEAEEEARQQDGAAEPDEPGSRGPGPPGGPRIEGPRTLSSSNRRSVAPSGPDVGDIRDTGRRPSRNRRRARHFRPSMRTAGLLGSAERDSARPPSPTTRSGTNLSTGDGRPVPGLGRGARLEGDAP